MNVLSLYLLIYVQMICVDNGMSKIPCNSEGYQQNVYNDGLTNLLMDMPKVPCILNMYLALEIFGYLIFVLCYVYYYRVIQVIRGHYLFIIFKIHLIGYYVPLIKKDIHIIW
jgi:hypothetical protein